ncbi:MAG: YicC/YloC family endoribonuclease [Bacteroidales bacterium]
MIRSMTGYGKASASLGSKTIDVEVRSLNSKSADISVKLPPAYRDKEMEIRNFISERLERGKIDLYVSMTGDFTGNIRINTEVAQKYFNELKALAEITGQSGTADYLSLILKMPDVIQTDAQQEDTEEWEMISNLILTAVEELNRFRLQEGNVLSQDLKTRILNIGALLEKTDHFENRRIEIRREKLSKALSELQDTLADPNRFEQELIYYLEKLDVTEEKIRLKNHLDFFISTLTDAGSNGRKLGFIIQEAGREINTLGAKANDTDIQKLVVMMKDELEKIKEQLANIL